MDKEQLQIFLDIADSKKNISENRTLFILYVCLTVLFLDVVYLVNIGFEPPNFVLLLVPILYTIGILPMALWLMSLKDNNSSRFWYQGICFLLICILFVWDAIVIAYMHTGYSWVYLITILMGIIMFYGMCRARYFKWLKAKKKLLQKSSQNYNPAMIPIMLIVMFVLKSMGKTILVDIQHHMIVCGIILVAFIFLTLAIIMLSNVYISKKYNVFE